ncbi:MAG TPA: UDP-N-acetylmuramoyl-tripeptide--D-alanyl-D-alanine ligase [Gemmatimonadales bacterium]|nr:UDP-N-acetylmuramoyl-tripeptide--D-alanyl-D-alanine ligase [Gemmatimonadales bacterium]
MSVWESAAVASALGVSGPRGLRFSGVGTDTRLLTPDTLFVALQGDRFDAHAFLDQAKVKGAAAAVVRRGTPVVAGLPVFEVEDTLAALGLLARARRRRLPPGSPVVAITGSSGKTSTKEMIRAVIATAYRVHATEGNLNNLVGVPLTILAAPDEAEALVVEAGASIPGEISRLRDIIEPTIAVITNVGYAHVEGFGSLAGVMQEKVSLAEGARTAVVGTDPPELAVEARRRAPTIVAGTGAGAQVRPDAAELDDGGHPRITWRGHTVTLPVIGFHQIENAMLALAVGRETGADPARVVAALADVRLPGGRGAMLTLGENGLTVIDDTYNANPSSLRWAVKLAHWLAGRRQRPLAVVVGSMLELGGESAKLHAAAAADIAALQPALVAVVGEFVDAFEPHRGALGNRLLTAESVEALGPRLKAALRGDEIVLLKASRGVALERVLRYLN